MSIREHIKRINRHGGSVASLIVLFGVIAFTHWSARWRMDMANRQFAIMDDRTVREMSAIDFIHGHLWIVVAYAAIFLGCLIWLEFRAAPRWAVWATFILLALPSLAYARACLHIGNKFIMWSVR
jgi:hypothetical protein